MTPLYWDCYSVKEVLGAGWTYVLTPENGIGRGKARHFYSLKEVGRVTRTSISELSIPVHAPEERTGHNPNEEYLAGMYELRPWKRYQICQMESLKAQMNTR